MGNVSIRILNQTTGTLSGKITLPNTQNFTLTQDEIFSTTKGCFQPGICIIGVSVTSPCTIGPVEFNVQGATAVDIIIKGNLDTCDVQIVLGRISPVGVVNVNPSGINLLSAGLRVNSGNRC